MKNISPGFRISFIASCIAMAGGGCVSRDISALAQGNEGEVLSDIPISTDIDILFVIDNSPSTSDKQQVFAANFRRFIDVLDTFPGGRPNVHIGVVSSTMDTGPTAFGDSCTPVPNDNGLLHNQPMVAGCTPPNGRFISDIANPDGSRTQNFPGGDTALASTFGCIAQLGSNGCPYEHQLASMKAALDGSRPENAGFVRPGAFLAVIVLTDEDDCSVRDKSIFQIPDAQAGPIDFRCQPLFAYTCDQPISPTTPGDYTNCRVRTDSYLEDPAQYITFLSNLKGDPGLVVTAVIGGNPDTEIRTGPITAPFNQPLALLPSCTATINGNAAFGRPGIRLDDYVQTFGDHGQFFTVCTSDYSQTLTDIGKKLFDVVSPCLSDNVKPTDIMPSVAGIQLNCALTSSQDVGLPTQTDTMLPRCAMVDDDTPVAGQPLPCWRVQKEPATCKANPDGLVLHVDGIDQAPANTHIRARCQLK